MKNLFKDKKITIAILLFAIISIAVLFTLKYKNYKNEKFIVNEILEYSNNFNEEIDRGIKLNILNQLISNEEKYSENYSIDIYESTLNELREWFINDYNVAINKDTIKDINGVNDSDAINQSKINLNKIIETIKLEGALESNEIEKYSKTIEDLVKSYDERLYAIDEAQKKAEKERLAKEERIAREKAEQEALAAAQAQQYEDSYDDNSYQHETPSNSNPSTPSSNTPTNPAPTQSPPASKPSGGVDISRLEHTWNTDENGNKIPGSDRWVDRSNGNAYDVNGNYLGNAYW